MPMLDTVLSPERGAPSPTVHLMTLTGELDLSAAARLGVELIRFRTAAARHVDVDLADVTFIDSSALNFFEQLRWVSQARGGQVTLRGVSPHMLRVLSIVGFDAHLKVGLNRYRSETSTF
jgi:anti-anti-sigma factor